MGFVNNWDSFNLAHAQTQLVLKPGPSTLNSRLFNRWTRMAVHVFLAVPFFTYLFVSNSYRFIKICYDKKALMRMRSHEVNWKLIKIYFEFFPSPFYGQFAISLATQPSPWKPPPTQLTTPPQSTTTPLPSPLPPPKIDNFDHHHHHHSSASLCRLDCLKNLVFD